MIVFPNAKINIGLCVLSKRADGYHTIETALFPTDWRDILEIVVSKENKSTFTLSGIPVDTASKENLVWKAFELLREQYDLPSIKAHLHKVIPFGAGLGGGSSDAAFTLKTLNELFELNLSIKALKTFAAKLGSDCPYFIENIPAIASGTGVELQPIAIKNTPMHVLLVFPNTVVSTAEAYDNLQIRNHSGEISMAEKLKAPIGEWKYLIKNDFEETVFGKYKQLRGMKELLYESGAIYASMSGSGSCLFGIYPDEAAIPSKFKSYTTWKGIINL